MKKSILNIVAIVAIACGFASCGQNQAVALSGAGATFPEPYYTMAFSQYKQDKGASVSYGGIGSGGGIRNLKDQVVDFAGSDAFLSDKEMKDIPAVIHVPTCLGAVVLAYNLNGIEGLRLNGELVADIFAGKVRKWNDARIAALNPSIKLPDLDIIPVYRSDGSGTTQNFTTYLSAVSASWKEQYGAGKSVNFPVGMAAKGNPGIAGVIGMTQGTIGYIGSEYALAQHIVMAEIENAAGRFVKPSVESISAAAKGELPADTRASIVNSSDPDAYPIACMTWLIVYKEQKYAGRSLEKAKATKALLQYMLSEQAQSMTSKVNYAPLPAVVVKQSLKNLEQLTYDGKSIN